MKPKRFYLPTFNSMVANMLTRHGHTVVGNQDDKWDAAVLTGGEDVCPFLYGELPLSRTRSNITRDRKEISFLKNCPTFKPKIGICRGGQLLNVFSGGSLWQDVNNHTKDHEIEVVGEGKVRVTSTHHQMMIPGDQATVIATANEADKFEGQDVVVNGKNGEDLEIAWYWNTNSLCFQPHPEYHSGECQELFMLCMQDFVFNPSASSKASKAS